MSPSIVGSTLLIVCTSSKNRRVTFSYQTVNSSWPCVGSSGPLHVVALVGHHRVQLRDRCVDVERPVPAVGEVDDLFLGERVAQRFLLRISSRVSPRPGDRAAVGRVLVVVGHFLVQQQVDQERAVLIRRVSLKTRQTARRLFQGSD